MTNSIVDFCANSERFDERLEVSPFHLVAEIVHWMQHVDYLMAAERDFDHQSLNEARDRVSSAKRKLGSLYPETLPCLNVLFSRSPVPRTLPPSESLLLQAGADILKDAGFPDLSAALRSEA